MIGVLVSKHNDNIIAATSSRIFVRTARRGTLSETSLRSSDRTARESQTATSLAVVPDVQTVTRGGRMCGSWLLFRAEYVPDGTEPYEYPQWEGLREV
eukprot:5404280-Prymnesium_polylepis.1